MQWNLPVVSWQSSASDLCRGVRLVEEAELAGRLWLATPAVLRWRLAPAVLQELEPPPVDETAPEHSAGAARGRSNWHRGGRAQSSWEGRPTTSWGSSWRPTSWTAPESQSWTGGGLGEPLVRVGPVVMTAVHLFLLTYSRGG